MGFNPNRTARLTFTDPAWTEAEVIVRLSVPVARHLEIMHWVSGEGKDDESVFRYFGDELLIEWNLENDEGVPYSADYDGVRQVDIAFISDCIKGVNEAIGEPEAPLEQQSGNGNHPEEDETEMAEKERRSGSRRTVESYSRMLYQFFGNLGKPPDEVIATEVLGFAHGVGLCRPCTRQYWSTTVLSDDGSILQVPARG